MGQKSGHPKENRYLRLDDYQTLTWERKEESKKDLERISKQLEEILGMADSRNGAVGLYNIGLSCCVNSLLQSFLMNRYFTMILRRIKIPFGAAEQKVHVPYQMLLLLEQMQRAKGKSVYPCDLTSCLSHHGITLFVLRDASELYCKLWNLIKDQITNTDLENSLRCFFRPEELTKANMCHCEQCDKKTTYLRRTKIMYLPQTLMLHLMRFCSKEGSRTKKIRHSLDFPQTLNFSQILTPEQYHPDAKKKSDGLYDLFAVVAHSGPADLGHYCAYIWSLSEHKWYCFNDSSVCEVSWDDVKCTYGRASLCWGETAYLLIYMRRNGRSF
ncbi:ubl carboxyl-terminal hydrolase 18 isoform 2-T2 [Liasis olivaceus]